MKYYDDHIIQEILNKIDILSYISQYVELKRKGKYFVGLCPLHSEDTPSFTIHPNNSWYCYGCGQGGTIIQFVMLYHKFSFRKAIEHLIDYANLDIDNNKIFSQVLNFMRRNKRRQNIQIENHNQHCILPPDIMNQYHKADIKEWIAEGISQKVMDDYDVRYDLYENRIVLPIHDVSGNIINIKGRTLCPNFKELGVRKYIYYYPLGKLDFLGGLYKKYDTIRNMNEVIVVEGLKSVMKLETWGINNAVSLETCRANECQIKLLLQLKSNIVIALDKNINIKTIKKDFGILTKFTNVYVMYDTKNLLKDKDAPCDYTFEIWQELYNDKIKL